LEFFFNSTTNQTLIVDTFRVIEHNSKHPEAPLKILKERILTFDVGFDTVSSPYLEPFYRYLIERYTENGVLMHWIRNWRDFKSLLPAAAEKEPEVLTLDHLGVGFQLYLFSLGAAATIFTVEVLIASVKKLEKKFIALYA